MARRSGDIVVSREAVVGVDASLEVVTWNRATEELTGVAAAEAIGRPCWLVLRGESRSGAVVCRRGCPVTRFAREWHVLPCLDMTIATTSGPHHVCMSTLVVHDSAEPLIVHLLRDDAPDGPRQDVGRETVVHLTTRQLQVLRLLADGVTARRIATRLGLAETTVRNHIRAVLSELGVHSQLEAVARARKQGLV